MGPCNSLTNKTKPSTDGQRGSQFSRKGSTSDRSPNNLVNIDKSNFVAKSEGSYEQYYTVAGGETLGEGSYGKVYKVTHKQSGQIRAMKMIKKDIKFNDQDILNEIEILKTIDHPKIVKIFEFFITEKAYFLITELVTEGELFNDIADNHKDQPYKEEAAAFIMYQIFSALLYCHSVNITHRDLKPENILIEKRANNDMHKIKIIDFGTAKIFEKGKGESKVIGSAYYIAPEVLFGNYNEKCDLWSCGVILYILLSTIPPFYGTNDLEITTRVKKGQYDLKSGVWNRVSNEAKNLIRGLLNTDVKSRLTAEEALRHDWFKRHNTKLKANPIKPDKIQQCLKHIQNYEPTLIIQQAALGYLVHNFQHMEEVQDACSFFNLIDEDNNGQISREEFRKALQRYLNLKEADMVEVDNIFDIIDADNNGYIEFEEFTRAAIDKSKFLQDDKLKFAFRFFDKDNSGEITIDEIAQVFFKDERTRDEKSEILKHIIKEVDVNGDGNISFEEFKSVMKKILTH
jgi:calcium-dependent protein kinase